MFLFVASAISAYILSLIVRRLALKLKIADFPAIGRKQHGRAVPLLGGLAPFTAFFSVSFAAVYIGILPIRFFQPLFWLFIASCLIMVGGFLDDKYNLRPKWQILFPIIAIFLAIAGGIRVEFITNPAGGILFLSTGLSLAVSFLWLLMISYTTKILDGLDGLVGGTAIFGAITIFLFATLSDFKEPSLSLLALILAGAFLGFLALNHYPAKLFLGEGGSVFSGFILGGLAIMTGAKIAVTLMVIALPLIDLLAVVIKRAKRGRPLLSGDRTHLHYLLVDSGWKPQNVVYLFWGLSAAMGFVAVFLPSGWKIASLIFIFILFFAVDLLWFKEK